MSAIHLNTLHASSLPIQLEREDAEDLYFSQLPGGGTPSPLPTANPTKSFWTHGEPGCNPLATEGSKGALSEDADIVVIGSGITGVSAAYHLKRLLMKEGGGGQTKVVMLEARDFCSGATGRNGGHLTPGLFSRMKELSDLYGSSEAVRNFAIERHTVDDIIKLVHEHGWEKDVSLVEGGHLVLLLTQKEVDDVILDIELAKKAGVEGIDAVKVILKEEVDQKYGTPHPVLSFPGSNLWPLRLMTKMFYLTQGKSSPSSSGIWSYLTSRLTGTSIANQDQLSSNFDLILHTHTPVQRITPSSDAYRWIVHTPRGDIKTKYIIHATNAYASHLLPHLSAPKTGIIPTRGQVAAIRASVPSPSLWSGSLPGWGGNQGYEYWFARPPSSDKERPLVILGGGRETSGPEFEYNIADDSVVNPVISKTLRAFLPAVYEGRFGKDVDAEMEWTGIMGFTRTHDPIVGRVSLPHEKDLGGQYIAAGYSGHGMPRAYACAEAVAEMIVADMNHEEWTIPDWLPRWYLTSSSLSEGKSR